MDVLQANFKRASQRLLDMAFNYVRNTSAVRQGQHKSLAQLLHRQVPAGALDVLRHCYQVMVIQKLV